MTAAKDLPGAFGSHNIIQIPGVSEEERHLARLTVVERCPEDAAEMLDTLGLLEEPVYAAGDPGEWVDEPDWLLDGGES